MPGGDSRRLLLARHGETDSNLSARFAGWNDDRLTPQGRAQAVAMAARLRPAGVRRIYTSPVLRAVETADVLSAELGVDVRTVHDLHEIELGPWKNLTEEEVARRWPLEFAAWRSAPDRFRLEGRETLAALQRRALAAMDQIGRAELAEPDLPVVAVTHLALIRVLWLAAAELPLSMYQDVRIANGELRALRWHGRGQVSHAAEEGWAVE